MKSNNSHKESKLQGMWLCLYGVDMIVVTYSSRVQSPIRKRLKDPLWVKKHGDGSFTVIDVNMIKHQLPARPISVNSYEKMSGGGYALMVGGI